MASMNSSASIDPRVHAGPQRRQHDDLAEEVEAVGQELRGLHRARQRRRHDRVGVDSFRPEKAREAARGLAAAQREVPVVVSQRGVLLHRLGVTDQEDLHAISIPAAYFFGKSLAGILFGMVGTSCS